MAGDSIVITVNRVDTKTLASSFSDLSIVPFPPGNPALHLLQTAGQVGLPPPSSAESGIPPTFREQAVNAFTNIAACLEVGGATRKDITKITIFVVNYESSMRQVLVDVISDFFPSEGEGKPHRPPSSLIGVAALAHKDFLIEVEASAAISVKCHDVEI